MILATRPALQKGNSIEVWIDWMTHHFDIIECNLDITVTLEYSTKILDILLLALLVILDLLRGETLGMFGCNNLTSDNQGIIAKHLIKEVYVLLIVSRTELLYIVKDQLATAKICQLQITLDDIHVEIH